jgi:hypothetical protein
MARPKKWLFKGASGQDEKIASSAFQANVALSKASNFGITGSLGSTTQR